MNILTIYPQHHWSTAARDTGKPEDRPGLYGIKEFLRDEPTTKERIQTYQKWFQREFPDLFVARHYPEGIYTPNSQNLITKASAGADFTL